MQTELKIDSNLKQLIPALTEQEFQLLETNILAEGCREPLLLWNGIIVDGHNRYEICQKHKLPYKTVEKKFESDIEVKIWIIQNQFGRRNLPAYERARLALKLEDIFREKAKENQKLSEGRGKKGCQISDNLIDTKKELAEIAGVSHKIFSIFFASEIERKAFLSYWKDFLRERNDLKTVKQIIDCFGELVTMVTEIKIRAERKAGQMLKEMAEKKQIAKALQK